MDPSDSHAGPRSSRGAEQRPPRRPGPPVLRARSVLTCPPHYPGESPGLRRLKIRTRRPSPMSRRVGTRDSVSRPAQGSLSLGPQACQPSQGRQLSGRLGHAPLPVHSPPVATEVYRQLLRQDFHLLERAAFARRTTHLRLRFHSGNAGFLSRMRLRLQVLLRRSVPRIDGRFESRRAKARQRARPGLRPSSTEPRRGQPPVPAGVCTPATGMVALGFSAPMMRDQSNAGPMSHFPYDCGW